MSHISRSLHDALDETLGFIGRALDRIRAGDGAESELHNVRVYLVNILELIERDPGIEAASDDLYQVAAVLAGGTDQGTRMARLLNEAFGFRDRLGLAQPSERAKQMGLSLARKRERGEGASMAWALEGCSNTPGQLRPGDYEE
jgi:hypothetical protein